MGKEISSEERAKIERRRLTDSITALVVLLCANQRQQAVASTPPQGGNERVRTIGRRYEPPFNEAPETYGSAVDSFSVSGSRSVRTGYWGS